MLLLGLTALGVGGATIFGALLGFCFKRIPHKWNDAILGFAAGVMLAAAILGLILPSLEAGSKYGVWHTAFGILCGALFLNFADRFMPHLHNIAGIDKQTHEGNPSLDRTLLFVMAIAIHNLPEGLAAGVGFGTGDIGNAITVALGIALQNIPEGMVIISPLLLNGISKKRTFLIAAFTGLIELLGTLIGFFAVTISSSILPFALAFAGGTMLYVISDEMIPETHSHSYERMATYSLLLGFILMMVMDAYLG